MERRSRIEEDALFVRMAKVKTRQRPAPHTLGESLVDFYKGTVQRTRKFAGIGEVWETLVSPDLNEHCCLESYRAGVLTVLVDSSPHMYRIKQLLLAGLQKQILELCRVQGLRKISLKPGRWYAGEEGEDRRLMFGR